MRPKRSGTTIGDVAREAGVSTSTVSRILNGSSSFSPDTEHKVRTAAQRLNYYPSASARGLRFSRTMTIGLLVPDLANMLYADYLRGAEHAAQGHGYSVLICEARNSVEFERMHLTRLFQHRVDGLLLAANVQSGDLLRLFTNAGIPVEPRRSEELPRSDLERQASKEAARRLIALGHKGIAVFVRHLLPGDPFQSSRVSAITAEMEAAFGPGARPEVVEAETVDQCLGHIERLRRLPRPPTAVVAGTHLLTPVLLEAIREAGMSIPEDLSFVTYGDSAWASAYRPPISVIRYDYYGEAGIYVERLVARIAGESRVPPPPIIPSQFVDRGSCGPAPAHAGHPGAADISSLSAVPRA